MTSKQKLQNEEIDLLELFFYMLRRWMWFLLAAVIGLGGALVFYHYRVSPFYMASAEIYITNSDTVISYQDIQLSAELTVDYEQIILSQKVLKSVIKDLDLDINYRILKNMISVTNPDDSHCLIISTIADSASNAVNITNRLVEYGIDQIYQTIGKDKPSVIDLAEEDAVVVVQSSRKKYALMGAMIGMVLIGALFTMRFLMDTTIKTEEDIEKYLGLNVLAIVPEAAGRKRNKKEDTEDE